MLAKTDLEIIHVWHIVDTQRNMYRHRFITIYSCLSPALDWEAQKLGSDLGSLETNPQHRAVFFSARTAHSSSSSRNFVSPIRQEPSLKTSLESHYYQPPKLHKEKKSPSKTASLLFSLLSFWIYFFLLLCWFCSFPRNYFHCSSPPSPQTIVHTQSCVLLKARRTLPNTGFL